MNTDQNLQATLRTSYRAAYNAYLALPRRSLSEIYRSSEIDTKSSEEHWLGDVPGVEEWVDERTYQDLALYSDTLTSKPYTTRGWRYHRIQNAGSNRQDLRDRMTRTIQQCDRYPDQAISALLVAGTSRLAFDGVAFFSDAAGKRLTDNLVTGTGISEAQLMTDLTTAFVQASQFTSDTGILIEVIPDTIVCSFALYLKFKKILTSNSSLDSGQNEGVVNPFRDFNIRLVWSPWITGNDWYLLTTQQGIFALYWQTTMVDGQRIILDLDETKLASAGYVGIAASIWGAPAYGFPWAALKVAN